MKMVMFVTAQSRRFIRTYFSDVGQVLRHERIVHVMMKHTPQPSFMFSEQSTDGIHRHILGQLDDGCIEVQGKVMLRFIQCPRNIDSGDGIAQLCTWEQRPLSKLDVYVQLLWLPGGTPPHECTTV